jgi:hypothetical protein
VYVEAVLAKSDISRSVIMPLLFKTKRELPMWSLL